MEWDVFWEIMFVMFVTIPLFMIWAFAIMDLFARRDLGGLPKVIWLLLILFLPLLGTLLYYLFRPVLHVDDIPELAQAQAGFVAERLTQLTALKEKGVISDEEFNKQRARLLAT